MEPKLAETLEFTVSGISVNTRNSYESQPSKAKLPKLWSKFYDEAIKDNIPNALKNSPVYGVYSEYESDASGPFTVTAGVSVSAVTASFSSVTVNGGKYLVFEAKGPVPKIVKQTWAEIEQFFETSEKFKRAFTTDYEVYHGADEVEIHVALA